MVESFNRLNKLNFANQKSVAYGELVVADSTAVQTIPNSTSYTKVTLWTEAGQSKRCVSSSTNDKITIYKNGVYRVSGSFSIESGTVNVVVRCAAFLSSAEQDHIHWKRKIATANDAGSASFTGFVKVSSAPADIDVRLRHDTAGNVNIMFDYANFNVQLVE
jgi:hypothetical protein